MLPPGASEASSSSESSRYYHSYSFVLLVAFRLSFFSFFSEEFFDKKTGSLFRPTMISNTLLSFNHSLCVCVRACVCVKLKRIIIIIALRLPREGKNTRFVAVRLFSGFLLSRSHHTCETFEHPTKQKQQRRVLFSTYYPNKKSCKRTKHHPSPRAVYACCLRPRNK